MDTNRFKNSLGVSAGTGERRKYRTLRNEESRLQKNGVSGYDFDDFQQPFAQEGDRRLVVLIEKIGQRVGGDGRSNRPPSIQTEHLVAAPIMGRVIDVLGQSSEISGVKRLDVALVEQGLCETRERAKRAILAGQVTINGQVAHKASDSVKAGDVLKVMAGEKYVSRGGYKLEHALQEFQLKVEGQTAIDVGASTGGFTDCLLQHGAAKVFAVDVGRGQLAWKLRQDPRVVVMERVNARELRPELFPEPFVPLDLAVMDCSFISLRKILIPVIALLRPSANIIALIKPQFEAGKLEADRGAGVITDPVVHERVLRELEAFVREQQWSWRGCVPSPLLGPAGNKEFLVWIEKTRN